MTGNARPPRDHVRRRSARSVRSVNNAPILWNLILRRDPDWQSAAAAPHRGRLGQGAVTLLALTLFAIGGCSRASADATPDGVVRLWLDKMESSTEDPRAMREAFVLLGPAARDNLDERAQRASRVQGRRVEPYEMLAEGRFGLKFRPKAMVSRIDGDRALVEVTGDAPLTEHALVHCAREPAPSNAWRVEPELPDVMALPRR